MTTLSALAPEAPDEILTVRRIAAPRELVFRAWTTPTHLDAWWGPDGFRTTTHAMAFEPGGRWLFTMHGPDGTDYSNSIDYREITEPARLVYDHGDGSDGPPHFHVVVTFETDGDGTRLAMRARFRDAAARAFVAEKVNAVEGGRQTIARLAAHVETLRAQG